MEIINWAILKEPLNWLTVWTMGAILGLLIVAILRHPGAQASTN